MLCAFHVAVYAEATQEAVDHDGTSAAASTAETRRYPKRNIERKNYHESSDEETDPGNFCFCEYNS